MSICQIAEMDHLTKEEKGIKRLLIPTTSLPKNWKNFLHVDENKTEQLVFLAQQVTCVPVDDRKEVTGR